MTHVCSKCRVRFDSEVHPGEIDKKVHLSKMSSPYVGIRKNHTDIFDMDKKVHLREMDFYVHFEKVGLLGTGISYLNCRNIIFTSPTPSTHTPHTTTIFPHSQHAHATQASNNSSQRPATHTPQNTLSNFPQLPIPPTFGNKVDDGGAYLNASGAPWMSINVAVQPLPSPDQWWQSKRLRRID
jgi:hypothetical protein